MREQKTAIIVHGGALRGAFAAGVMYELSHCGLRSADLLMGVSSGVPTAAYYATGQYDFIKRIWLEELANKNLVNYTNFVMGRPIFDLEYLIETVLQKKFPLDVKKIINSPTRFVIPAFNYLSRQLVSFDNTGYDMKYNFWKLMKAAMTNNDRTIDWGGALRAASRC